MYLWAVCSPTLCPLSPCPAASPCGFAIRYVPSLLPACPHRAPQCRAEMHPVMVRQPLPSEPISPLYRSPTQYALPAVALLSKRSWSSSHAVFSLTSRTQIEDPSNDPRDYGSPEDFERFDPFFCAFPLGLLL